MCRFLQATSCSLPAVRRSSGRSSGSIYPPVNSTTCIPLSWWQWTWCAFRARTRPRVRQSSGDGQRQGLGAACRSSQLASSEVRVWSAGRPARRSRSTTPPRMNMTDWLPELAGLPAGLTLDGELLARAEDELPTLVCAALAPAPWVTRGIRHARLLKFSTSFRIAASGSGGRYETGNCIVYCRRFADHPHPRDPRPLTIVPLS
jgi:hypothetical protein